MNKFIKLYKQQKIKQAFRLVLLSSIIFVGFYACENEKFDAPPHEKPHYSGNSNISLSDFKARYDHLLVKLNDDEVISGVVTANDVSGNLYKQLFIEDESGGLMLALDRNNIYNDIRVGQRLFIETTDLYIGKYGGMHQLGYRYSKDNNESYSIGQIPWELAKLHVFKDDYPQPDNVKPKVITSKELTSENFGRLVKLEGVYFDDGGEIFSYPTQEGAVQTLNRVLRFADMPSRTVTVRISSAANFANDIIPHGVGSVTGILTVFNNIVQLLVREIEDLDFDENPNGWGIENNPWSASYALSNQDIGKTGWVSGVIVGTIKPGINQQNLITNNDDLIFTAPFPMDAYILIAQNADESNWEKCLLVNLPAGSTMREYLNLSDHEANVGKEVGIRGSLQNILGAAGLRVTNGDAGDFVFKYEGEEILYVPFTSTLNPFFTYNKVGHHKWEIDTKYNYAIISGYESSTQSFYENEDWLISPSLDLSVYSSAHISFEHVSRYGENSKDLSLWISSDYIDGDPSYAHWSQIVIQNYSSGNDWYDWTNSGDLNIPSEFLEQENVHIAFKYLSNPLRAATWQIREFYVFLGPGSEDEEPEPEYGDGSYETPFNISDIRTNQGLSGKHWVKGFIVGTIDGMNITKDSNFSAPFESNTNLLLAATKDETNINHCIPVQLPMGDVRDALNLNNHPENKGKEVKLYGSLEAYFGKDGLKSVSDYEFQGASNDPDAP